MARQKCVASAMHHQAHCFTLEFVCGLDDKGTAHRLLFAATTIEKESPTSVRVNSGTSRGACVGDSGGPLLVLSDLGWRINGVLSTGSATCVGSDTYVNLAEEEVQTWLAAAAARLAPGE